MYLFSFKKTDAVPPIILRNKTLMRFFFCVRISCQTNIFKNSSHERSFCFISGIMLSRFCVLRPLIPLFSMYLYLNYLWKILSAFQIHKKKWMCFTLQLWKIVKVRVRAHHCSTVKIIDIKKTLKDAQSSYYTSRSIPNLGSIST